MCIRDRFSMIGADFSKPRKLGDFFIAISLDDFTTKKQLLNKFNSTLTSNKNISYTKSR